MVQTLSTSINSMTPLQTSSLLVFEGISKSFAGVKANDNISLSIKSGGIHAIVGENGAGKSTLTKILYGYYSADSGTITLDGSALKIKSPDEARRMGIGMVHQQMALVPTLTVFENIVLGDPRLPFSFRNNQIERQVKQKADSYGFDFDLSTPVANLGIAERQKLEIFKLLWRDAKILLLDEPTSQLTAPEAEEILTLIERLACRDSNRIVIFITHHISEILRFATSVTVLRKGKCIATKETANLTTAEIAKMMMVSSDSVAMSPENKPDNGQTLVELKNISTSKAGNNRAISDINLSIKAGEIVGVAGISSSGQNELGQLVAGLLPSCSGKISWTLDSKACKPRDLVGYIPSEQNMAYAHGISLAANSFIKCIDSRGATRLGILKPASPKLHAKALIADFKISPPAPDVAAESLSGGNLQRLIIARELRSEARVIVADNPCAGLDVSTAQRVAAELKQAAASSRAVLLISPDLDELISTCNRIVIMFKGKIVGEQLSSNFDYQTMTQLMCGKISDNTIAESARAS